MKAKIGAIIYDTYIAVFGSPYSFNYPSQIEIDENYYMSAEHYYIAEEARFFNDTETLDKIMSSTNINEIKALEKEIKGFDRRTWSPVSKEKMQRATLAKFSQNDSLKKLFLDKDFDGKDFVYGSATDIYWGVGLDFRNPKIDNKKHWLGVNAFGDILTEVRKEL